MRWNIKIKNKLIKTIIEHIFQQLKTKAPWLDGEKQATVSNNLFF